VDSFVDGEIADAATGLRFPGYYDGTNPDYCTVRVVATYTCLADDAECNNNPDVAVQLCQTSCGNNEGCPIDNLDGNPMLGRVCGLLGGARPACTDTGQFSAQGDRQLQAVYRINVCMNPPMPPMSPPPPPVLEQPEVGPLHPLLGCAVPCTVVQEPLL
jgi:hypothetical protein